jgi:hypothetical protein
MCVFVAMWGGGWNLFKIKTWSTFIQENIFTAILTLDNPSSLISANLIPEQFFQSKQMMQFCSVSSYTKLVNPPPKKKKLLS